MEKNLQKGNAILIIVLLLGTALVGGYFWMNRGGVDIEENMEDEMMEEHMDDEIMEEGDEMMEDDSMMMDSSTGSEQEGEVKEFNLNGKNFEFSVKEIKVKKGDKVRINFSSESGFHDWVIDEFDARTKQLQTGESGSVEFVADQTGTFEYYCSVGQHRANGMVGKLIVE